MKAIRVYADTSVFGGVFDTEFDTVSLRFFHHVKNKDFHLVTSVVVAEELKNAPNRVRNFFDEIASSAEVADISSESLQLQQAYLKAGIVSPKSATDALHVSLATVSNCSIIVSWNFHHIVHFNKIPIYNAINMVEGYRNIAIHSPSEVIYYDDKDV